jgi:hypothetical protein
MLVHCMGSFGADVNAAMCGGRGGGCAVCCVCRTGFELRLAGTGAAGGRVRPLRYGQGLYFSSTSSKSDDYAAGSERAGPGGTRLRCMFLCKVTSFVPCGPQIEFCKDMLPCMPKLQIRRGSSVYLNLSCVGDNYEYLIHLNI